MSIFNSMYINNIKIPNKIIFAPINTGFFSNGHLNESFFNFYYKRSGNYIGVCYIGNVSINSIYSTNSSTAYISNENKRDWIKLTKGIEKRGSIPAIQLSCRCSNITAMTSWVNFDSNNYIFEASREISNMPKFQIENIVESFIESAIIAWESGFKIIQIHAAHGYFISLLLSPIFNKRNDEYNYKDAKILGDIFNRLYKEVPKAIIDIRISFYEGIKTKEEEFIDKYELIKKIISMPVHIISLSNGIYNLNKNLIYPFSNTTEIEMLELGYKLSTEFPYIFWNTCGNLKNLEIIEKYNSNNLLFSFGRQLICDNHFICKYLYKTNDKIKRCSNCGNCHYYSHGWKGIKSCK